MNRTSPSRGGQEGPSREEGTACAKGRKRETGVDGTRRRRGQERGWKRQEVVMLHSGQTLPGVGLDRRNNRNY